MAFAPATDEIPLALDNSVLSNWRKDNPRIREAINEYQRRLKRFPALPSISVFESLYGIQKKADQKGNLSELDKLDLKNTRELVRSCVLLDFNYRAAEIAAHVCGQFKKNMPKNLLRDVFIASTALAHGYGVATENREDFERIGDALPQGMLLRLAVWKH